MLKQARGWFVAQQAEDEDRPWLLLFDNCVMIYIKMSYEFYLIWDVRTCENYWLQIWQGIMYYVLRKSLSLLCLIVLSQSLVQSLPIVLANIYIWFNQKSAN